MRNTLKLAALLPLVATLAACGATPTAPLKAPAAAPAALAAPYTAVTIGKKFSSSGDPHEVSGDGCAYDNQLIGVFTKLKGTLLDDMELQVRQVPQPELQWGMARFNTAVGIRVNAAGTVVRYFPHADALEVAGKYYAPAARVSHDLPGGGRIIFSAGTPNFSVMTAAGDQIELKPQRYVDYAPYVADPRPNVVYSWTDISGKIGPRLGGDMRGELGTFDGDGNPNDDLRSRNNLVWTTCGASPVGFEESWRVSNGASDAMIDAGLDGPLDGK